MIMDDKAMDRTFFFKNLFDSLDLESKGYLHPEEVRELLYAIHHLMTDRKDFEPMVITD